MNEKQMNEAKEYGKNLVRWIEEKYGHKFVRTKHKGAEKHESVRH